MSVDERSEDPVRTCEKGGESVKPCDGPEPSAESSIANMDESVGHPAG